MSHFSPAEWVDFTRGLLSEQETAVLQSHLDQRCEECLRSAGLWRAVQECLSAAVQYRVPDRLLTSLRTAYTAHKPWRWLLETARWAELSFDTLRHPVPALVRGSTPSSRQLVHEAEPFVIDLRLEADPVRNRVLLIGQILDSDHPEKPMGGVDVILLNGEELLAKTRASSSGEFNLQCERENDLRLFINIPGQSPIGIDLIDGKT
jgi:hypothetical protein